MAHVDFGKYKRIVQYFWDPAPINNEGRDLPIWCLGCQYTAAPAQTKEALSDTVILDDNASSSQHKSPIQTATRPGSASSSLHSGLAYDETTNDLGEDGGWPAAFLDDFEARLWLTYRSGFPAIAREADTRSTSTMSFADRVRSQLVDQNGFTSDTGWGCMIRSGQSLLANAIVMLRLGRGLFVPEP